MVENGRAEDSGGPEPVGWALSSGAFVDFLRKFPRPVFRLPGEQFFQVMLHGHGFSVQVVDSDPIIGFVTSRYVAARSVSQAEEIAKTRMKESWETFYPEAEGGIQVEVESIEPVAVGSFFVLIRASASTPMMKKKSKLRPRSNIALQPNGTRLHAAEAAARKLTPSAEGRR